MKKAIVCILMLCVLLVHVPCLGEEKTGVFDFENKTVLLNSGYTMPNLGLGTYALDDETCVRSVMALIENGGRLIDTAYMYGNEEAVGEGVRRAMAAYGVPREDIFVITKIYPSQFDRPEEAIEAALAKTRVHVLRDASALVTDGKRPLYFLGVDYPRLRNLFALDGAASMEKAMEGVPDHAVKVLLAHHPDFFDAAAAHGIELALAGHTHGGQLGIFGVPIVPPVFKYMRGVYRVGITFGYVHSGNGSWFPYRLGCPPEIAVFSLKKKQGISKRY